MLENLPNSIPNDLLNLIFSSNKGGEILKIDELSGNERGTKSFIIEFASSEGKLFKNYQLKFFYIYFNCSGKKSFK